MSRRVYFGVRCSAITIAVLTLALLLPAVEKFFILSQSDLVFVGKTSGIRRSLAFTDWRIMWVFSGEIEVYEVLQGPVSMEGKKIQYMFRCGECPLLSIPPAFPAEAYKESLWFVRRFGSGWEAANGAADDPGVQKLCEVDNFKRAIRNEPRPYPRECPVP